MPPRPVRQLQDGGFRDWYESLPIITRYHATISLVLAAAGSLKVMSPWLIVFTWKQGLFGLQIWRFLTNFLFLGGFSPLLVFRMIWLIMYGKQLEQGIFAANTADYAWMYIVGMLTCLALSVLPWFHLLYFGPSLVFMLLYVWSRHNPEAQTKLYGLVAVKAVYLPFAFMAVELCMSPNYLSRGVFEDIAGVLAGHMYYYLKEIEPRRSGRDLIPTPIWLYVLYPAHVVVV